MVGSSKRWELSDPILPVVLDESGHFPVRSLPQKEGINVSIVKPKIDGFLSNYDTLGSDHGTLGSDPVLIIVNLTYQRVPHEMDDFLTGDVRVEFAEATMEAEEITGSCMANLWGGGVSMYCFSNTHGSVENGDV